MRKIWNFISFLGCQEITDNYSRRNVVLTNRIAFSLFFIILILLTMLIGLYGINPTSPLIALAAVSVGLIGLLNYFKLFQLSRFLLAIFAPVTTLFLTIHSKLTYKPFTEIQFYEPRLFILSSCVIPILIFRLSERSKLLTALLINFLLLILIDPIHNLFNVGYYQSGLTNIYYPYLNYVSIIGFLILTSSVMILKIIIEKAESENKKLLEEQRDTNSKLKNANENLHQMNQEVEAQNEEILSQSEELLAKQEVIEQQKRILERYTEKLENLIEKKSNDLVKTNQELVKHNNELRQFSYTISHNLRAPIARMLGLTNLLELQSGESNDEVKKIAGHIHESAKEFDVIIKDLNKIIDIRNEIYRIREKVFFEQEWKLVISILSHQITSDIAISSDFSKAPSLYTVRPILNSVLYNLLANAIKYRSLQRELIISVRSETVDGYVLLTVEDNGLGINLDAYGKDVFGLYKRFHTHTEGKGLGLYLVKSQLEAIEGKVEVISSLNTGTTFTVYFKIPDEVEGQICYESDCGKIFYNARINVVGIQWKKQVSSDEYRTLFTKCVEMVRLYKTPYWISDMRMQGVIDLNDQIWMVERILPQAVREGLKMIAGIYDSDQHNETYRDRIRETGVQLDVPINFFNSWKDAEMWIEGQTNINTQEMMRGK